MGVMFLCAIPAAAIAFAISGPNGSGSIVSFALLWTLIWIWPYMKIRKDYLLGVTDRRVLLVQIKTPLWSFDLENQVGAWQWPSATPPRMEIKVGTLRSTVKIEDANKPVFLKVPYAGQKGAKARAEALSAAFSGALPPRLA